MKLCETRRLEVLFPLLDTPDTLRRPRRLAAILQREVSRNLFDGRDIFPGKRLDETHHDVIAFRCALNAVCHLNSGALCEATRDSYDDELAKSHDADLLHGDSGARVLQV